MKKITLLSVFLLSCIAALLSFSGKKKVMPLLIKPAVSIVECLPPLQQPAVPAISAAEFKRRYGMEPMQTRKNVDNLTQAEINAIKVGVLKMRALPYTDPTSWGYQAAIHGTTMTDDLPSWNMCHRPGEGIFFLAWHRMYVYFFERILRSKSGRANLTLPYWNYQLNPVMPFAFRDKSPGNPLYNPTRSIAINNGGTLPASISTAFASSLDIIPYYTFQGNLNSGPHGSVHTSIGGDMAVVSTSVKDPVFWLHHSNIDRLWEEWRSKCNGRANPVDTTWLNKTYTFFDEYGTPVSMKGSQVMEISSQLNYRYDDRPPVITCPTSRPTLVSRETLLTKETLFEMNGRKQSTDFVRVPSPHIDSLTRINRRMFNFRSATTPERLVIIFDGVRIQQMPQGVVEVYLNLRPGVTPSPNSNNFAGLLDLFSADHHATHTGPGQTEAPVELDATKAAQALGLTIAGLRTAEISFITRGPSLNGVEVPAQAQLTVRRIRFAVDRYRN